MSENQLEEENLTERDDLLCDDLKPLPNFEEFILPSWIPKDMYSDLLSVHSFFFSFSRLFPKDLAKNTFSLNEIATAVIAPSSNDSLLLDVFMVLLRTKSMLGQNEDGDEVDVDKAVETGAEISELEYKPHTDRIREIYKLSKKIRECHGENVRNLRLNRASLTDVVRLTLETSGSFRLRKPSRGGYRCYEDEGYVFVKDNHETMNRLKYGTIYDISPSERMAIIKVFVQQLLTYQMFREKIVARMRQMQAMHDELNELEKSNGQEERTSDKKTHRKIKTEKKAIEISTEVKDGTEKEAESDDEGVDPCVRSKEVLEEIFCSQVRMGPCFLGRDRAFRSYFYLHKFELLIIERPDKNSISTTCCEPTPIANNRLITEISTGEKSRKKSKTAFVKTSDELDKERIRLLACSGTTENCAVHGRDLNESKFLYYVEENGIQKLLCALNKHGVREKELATNISLLWDCYAKRMNKLAEKSQEPDFLLTHLGIASEVEIQNSENLGEAFANQFRDDLLKLEEKAHKLRLGTVSCTVERSIWRKQLKETSNTTMFCHHDCILPQYSIDKKDVLYTSSDLQKELNIVQRLGVALLQLVQGLCSDCFGKPFINDDKRIRKLHVFLGPYISWQKELIKCNSVSALAVFMITFERAVRWKYIKRPELENSQNMTISSVPTATPGKTRNSMNNSMATLYTPNNTSASMINPNVTQQSVIFASNATVVQPVMYKKTRKSMMQAQNESQQPLIYTPGAMQRSTAYSSNATPSTLSKSNNWFNTPQHLNISQPRVWQQGNADLPPAVPIQVLVYAAKLTKVVEYKRKEIIYLKRMNDGAEKMNLVLTAYSPQFLARHSSILDSIRRINKSAKHFSDKLDGFKASLLPTDQEFQQMYWSEFFKDGCNSTAWQITNLARNQPDGAKVVKIEGIRELICSLVSMLYQLRAMGSEQVRFTAYEVNSLCESLKQIRSCQVQSSNLSTFLQGVEVHMKQICMMIS